MDTFRKMHLLLPNARIIEIWFVYFFRKVLARVLDLVLRDFCEIWNLHILWKYQKIMRNHIYFKSYRWTNLERCASCSPRPKLLKDGLGLFRKMLARVSDFVFRDFCEIWNLLILPKYQKTWEITYISRALDGQL